MDEPPRGVGVVEVEVRQRESGVLLDGVPPTRRARDAVARAVLVRVLAVAQRVAGAFEREVDELRECFVALQPRDDLRVERRRARERRDRERSARPVADAVVVGVELLEERRVLRRVGDDGDERVVLGRGTDHRGPADVDGLDVGTLRERVEVRHDEVERADAVGRHVVVVGRLRTVSEDPAVDLRVQGHDAVVEDGRDPGDVVDRGHRNAGVGDRLGGAARRHELHAAPVELPGELDDARLVVHREQRPRDLRAHH